jgi:hypothetical protein
MERLFKVQQEIEEVLKNIEPLFLNARLTLIVRNPDLQDGDMILTKDDLDEVIKSIEALKLRDNQ